MKTITDSRLTTAIWGASPGSTRPDLKDYLHPTGLKIEYLQSWRAATQFKKTPQEFASMAEYREAWKEHRESKPIVARVLDAKLHGHGVTYCFDTEEEFKEWKTSLDRTTRQEYAKAE